MAKATDKTTKPVQEEKPVKATKTAKAQKEWKEFTNQLFISANDALSQITAQSEIYLANRNKSRKKDEQYDEGIYSKIGIK